MSTLLNVILASFLISLIAFIVIFTLSLKEKLLNKILLILFLRKKRIECL